MCGIFGLACAHPDLSPRGFLAAVTAELFTFSETRGREAAGIALHVGSSIEVLKAAGSASAFMRSARYRQLVADCLEPHAGNGSPARSGPIALIGHSRLVTNGFQSNDENNQPVTVPGAVGIHNGIVTNEADLWAMHPELEREAQVDTELLLKVLTKHVRGEGGIASGVRRTFEEMRGSASTAVFLADRPLLLLATNTGSLFGLWSRDRQVLAFASERYILQRLLEGDAFRSLAEGAELSQVPAYSGITLDLETFATETFDAARHEPVAVGVAVGAVAGVGAAAGVGASAGAGALGRLGDEPNAPQPRSGKPPGRIAPPIPIRDRSRRSADIRRCTRCILPATYPLIEFDAQGVCDYCRRWRSVSVQGAAVLEAKVEPYRSKDGSPDCIVAFSGGRDSTYGLHYMKTVLGMNPIAFTYDWGMVTDLARRNQARICGKLGIEHIVRSADIAQKRRYVRKNVEAWLHRPELGMVTLFTAGDKEFYHHARQLRKETGVKLVIFCTGNMIEDTPYKTGFCGIKERDHGMTLTGMWAGDKLRLLSYYMKQYALNPRYINESLWDTLKAFWHTFVVKDDFLYLFHYLPWSEDEIVGTIRREYDWEDSPDTKTTWRIGDGTAAFYNYIYSVLAGWTEDEVMLSNMIREDLIDRDEALRRAKEYSQPRIPSIQEYAQMIGINFEETLSAIHAAPRLY